MVSLCDPNIYFVQLTRDPFVSIYFSRYALVRDNPNLDLLRCHHLTCVAFSLDSVFGLLKLPCVAAIDVSDWAEAAEDLEQHYEDSATVKIYCTNFRTLRSGCLSLLVRRKGNLSQSSPLVI
jgi:hypothetical protein